MGNKLEPNGDPIKSIGFHTMHVWYIYNYIWLSFYGITVNVAKNIPVPWMAWEKNLGFLVQFLAKKYGRKHLRESWNLEKNANLSSWWFQVSTHPKHHGISSH